MKTRKAESFCYRCKHSTLSHRNGGCIACPCDTEPQAATERSERSEATPGPAYMEDCAGCYANEPNGIFCPLHAAAPELLAFLKEIRGNANCDSPEENELVKRADELIAKAEAR